MSEDRDAAREIGSLLGRAFMRLIRAGDECRDLQEAWHKLRCAYPWLSRCYLCNEYECQCEQEVRQKGFAEHLRSLRGGDQEEQQQTWEHLEEVLAEDGKL